MIIKQYSIVFIYQEGVRARIYVSLTYVNYVFNIYFDGEHMRLALNVRIT